MGWKEAVVKIVPARVLAPIVARRTWTRRVVTAGDDHLTMYWESAENPRRRALVDLLVAEVQKRPEPSLLEFGSHVGVNFRLLAERLPGHGRFYAVEPNHEAVEFLRAKLPGVTALRADHRGFLAARDLPAEPVTLSFANAVFYSMSPRATRKVLRKMLATSDIVVIGDNLDNAEGRGSEFNEEHKSFRHPFATWLRHENAEIEIHELDETDYALSGFVVARRAGSPTAATG